MQMETTQAKIAQYTAVLREQKTAENTIVSYERDLYQMADYLRSVYGAAGLHRRSYSLTCTIWKEKISVRRP